MLTCIRMAKTIISTETNKTCQVTTANTPRLLNTFNVALVAHTNVNGTSKSTIVRSDETCTSYKYFGYRYKKQNQ
jgi:hypothetical protein